MERGRGVVLGEIWDMGCGEGERVVLGEVWAVERGRGVVLGEVWAVERGRVLFWVRYGLWRGGEGCPG